VPGGDTATSRNSASSRSQSTGTGRCSSWSSAPRRSLTPIPRAACRRTKERR